jgi:hypothetical protein
MHSYQSLLAIKEIIRKIIDEKDCCKPFQIFFDRNESVRDNEMVVLIDTEEEQVVDDYLLEKKIKKRMVRFHE